MARITGGEVTYMERRKIGEYEHKEAKAVLTFSLDEGDDHDATLDSLGHAAKAKVYEMLGLIGKAAPYTGPAPAPLTKAAVMTPEAQAALAVPAKRGPGRPPKVASPIVVTEEAPKVSEPVVDVAKPTDKTPEHDADLDMLLEDEPKPEVKKIEPDPIIEVTDAMLQSEVTKVMKKINNGVAIKDVIRKTLTAAGIKELTGKQLRDIPMPFRPAFIAQIGAL